MIFFIINIIIIFFYFFFFKINVMLLVMLKSTFEATKQMPIRWRGAEDTHVGCEGWVVNVDAHDVLLGLTHECAASLARGLVTRLHLTARRVAPVQTVLEHRDRERVIDLPLEHHLSTKL